MPSKSHRKVSSLSRLGEKFDAGTHRKCNECGRNLRPPKNKRQYKCRCGVQVWVGSISPDEDTIAQRAAAIKALNLAEGRVQGMLKEWEHRSWGRHVSPALSLSHDGTWLSNEDYY